MEDRAQVSDKLAMVVDYSKESPKLGKRLKAWCSLDGFYLFFRITPKSHLVQPNGNRKK